MTDYTVIRTSRKTMALEITADCRVVVRAPLRTTDGAVAAFVAAHEGWLKKHLPRMQQRQAKRTARQVTPEQEQALRRLAAQVIPGRVAHYSRLMGLVPTAVKITGAQKRFGSCSGRNSLCFSWRLMQYPPEAIDYVVVHELAHIRHHNHSAAFYGLIAQYMPDYPARQALLRD